MFDINALNLSFFHKYRHGIYIKNDVPSNLKIYKYTSLPVLYTLLDVKNGIGRFQVSNRDQFSDQREKGEFYDLRNCFRMDIANVQPTAKQTEHWKTIDEQIEEASHLYASCWTCKKMEDFLMWKAYSGIMSGVRIGTSVEKLRDSLRLKGCKLVAAKMEYGKEKTCYEVEDSMFYKTTFYQGEDEFRFYVVNDEEKRSARFYLNVDPRLMIEEIILSPFMDIAFAQFIRDMLYDKFEFLREKVLLSEILEYRK